jgi:hypothetical protein
MYSHFRKSSPYSRACTACVSFQKYFKFVLNALIGNVWILKVVLEKLFQGIESLRLHFVIFTLFALKEGCVYGVMTPHREVMFVGDLLGPIPAFVIFLLSL